MYRKSKCAAIVSCLLLLGIVTDGVFAQDQGGSEVIEIEGARITRSEYDMVEAVKAILAAGDPQMCASLPEYFHLEGEALTRVPAVVTSNLCYNAYAKSRLDIATCLKIDVWAPPNPFKSLAIMLHDACLYDVQLKQEAFALEHCTAMADTSSWFFNHCIVKLAAAAKDPVLCDGHLEKDTRYWRSCHAEAGDPVPLPDGQSSQDTPSDSGATDE